MLSAGGGCEITVTTREKNSLEEVQGATTGSQIPPPLLQDLWPCKQLLRVECHPPFKRNLATDQDEPAAPAAQ